MRKVIKEVLHSVQSGKLMFLGFIFILIVLVGFMEHISSLFVNFADALTQMTMTNKLIANLLLIWGFSHTYWIIRQKTVLTARLAIKCYVMTALGMAGWYYLIYISHSNCYSFFLGAQPNVSILDFVYFSFVSVTTLGYGDIVPNHTFVRLLVVLQLMFGMFLILKTTARKCTSTNL